MAGLGFRNEPLGSVLGIDVELIRQSTNWLGNEIIGVGHDGTGGIFG
jgi:hypothetical protein